MVLNEKIKHFLVLILLLDDIKRLCFLDCAGSYKKMGAHDFISSWNYSTVITRYDEEFFVSITF